MLERYNNHIKDLLVFMHGTEDGVAEQKKRRRIFITAPIPTICLLVFALIQGGNIMTGVSACIGILLGLYIMYDAMIFKAAKNRRLQMRLELSAVLDRIAVLLDAGVTLWNAVVIVSQNCTKEGAFENELRKTVNSFCGREGYYFEPEVAFEEMASRCGDATVSTFVSMIVQNSRKGTEELAELLRIQAINARNERRVIAKQLSDEASTLMLIPSALVLVAVLVLVAAPAVIQFF